MAAVVASRLSALARVIVRIGLNLQRGQRLLLTDPYDAHGVPPEGMPLATAVREAALAAGAAGVELLAADPERQQRCLLHDDRAGFSRLVGAEVRTMERCIAEGGALLFLSGGGNAGNVPADRVVDFRREAWRQAGPAIQNLMAGATNWTVVPAPTTAWADRAYDDLPADARLPALWATVLDACRVGGEGDPVENWQAHLAALEQERSALNERRARRVRFTGEGTDLNMKLPSRHRWCTAAMTTRGGLPFVVNLPTEEIFTLPDAASAEGTVRVAAPIQYGGAVIARARLEFAGGRVVRARAEHGEEFLHRLLATDDGAARLGEVAVIPALRRGAGAAWQRAARDCHHVLLDENRRHHVALGESYGFTLDSWLPSRRNRSLIHVDLPLDAAVEFDH